MTKAVLIALAVAISGWYVYHSRAEITRLEQEKALARQNLSAVTDTLRTVQNAKGNVEHSRLILVQELADLERTNARLADRVNRLSGELEVAISATATAESVDTTSANVSDIIRSELVQTREDSGTFSWVYDPALPSGNRLLVEGRSGWVADSAWTEITRHLVQVDMVVAIREREDGLREAVASSTWPGLVLDVEGVVLEPRLVMPPPRRSWMLPAGIGFGLGVILWEVVR